MSKINNSLSEIMKYSAIAMVLFLMLHLYVNLVCAYDYITNNGGIHYNATINTIKNTTLLYSIENILSLGFLIHIICAIFLIKTTQKSKTFTKEDKLNAYITGALISGFFILHISQIMSNNQIKTDTYQYICTLFINNPIYNIIYILTGLLLGFHIYSNAKRRMRNAPSLIRKIISRLGIIIGIGYAIIPIFFLLK